jgi:hypothetical protein
VAWEARRLGETGTGQGRPLGAGTVVVFIIAFVLWWDLGPWAETAPLLWAFPFGVLVCGIAAGLPHDRRVRLLWGAGLFLVATGALAGAQDEGRDEAIRLAVGGAIGYAVCVAVVLQVWTARR